MLSRSYILTYHSIDPSGSVISIHPEVFREQMRHLAAEHLPVLPLEEAIRTPGAIAITFDDAFENVYQHAFPILQEFGLPATVYVVSGYCGRSNDWPGQPKSGIPILPLMNWAQLREIARHRIELGVHTVNHPHLPTLPVSLIERELDLCLREVEQNVGVKVSSLAYPYGDSSPAVRAAAAERFSLACGTSLAPVSATCDLFNLPRLDAFYLQRPLWFRSFTDWRGRGYLAMRRAMRQARELYRRQIVHNEALH